MSGKPLTGMEKAALLLKSLSPSVVDKVLGLLDPRQSRLIKSELEKAGMRSDLEQAMSNVLNEAVETLAAPTANKSAAAPGSGKPTNTPSKPEAAVAALATEESAADPLAVIAAIPPDVLTTALDTENSRTISLLMNRLDVEIAGQIYKRLSSAKRKEVSLRFTESTVVSDELLKHIAKAVLTKCQSIRLAGPGLNPQEEREKRMAALLRSLERTERMETLQALEESDAALAGRIKAMLYLFEDILRMENASIQKLLSEIDMRSLAAALFGAEPTIRDRIVANLSRRAQESLKEEIELTGKVPAAKVKQARQMLEEAMQRLDQRGEFNMME
jgi:flagellar motor switch protein FliG